MYLKELNTTGIKLFEDYLQKIHSNENPEYPEYLLEDERYSDSLSDTKVTVNKKIFQTKLELAIEIDKLFKESEINMPEKHIGLFCWLSLFYFDSISKKNKNSQLTIEKGKDFLAYYIPDMKNYIRYYRHKILGAYRIYVIHKNNPDGAMAILGSSPSTHGEIVEQFASRQELITNPGIVKLLTYLYWDIEKKALKVGYSSKVGSPRRLAALLAQLDMTYDLQSVHINELLKLLPKEFNKHKKNTLF